MESGRKFYTNADILEELKGKMSDLHLQALCGSIAVWETYQAENDFENYPDHMYNVMWWMSMMDELMEEEKTKSKDNEETNLPKS